MFVISCSITIALCLSLCALLALVVTISITALLFELWPPLKPMPAYKTILDGSPVVVREFNSFFYEMAVVTLDNNFNHSNSSIDFYVVKGSCDMIGVRKTDHTVLTKKNASDYVLKDYVLKGSVFLYEISGKGDVYFVNVCAYRLSDYNRSSPEYCSAKVKLRQGSVSYKVLAPGYYYFRVEQSKHITDYYLMITGTLMVPNNNQGERDGCIINSTNLQCQIDIPFLFFKPKYCLLAELYQPFDNSEVKLVVQVKEGRSWITRCISLFVILISLISLLVFSICTLKFCNFCKWLKYKF